MVVEFSLTIVNRLLISYICDMEILKNKKVHVNHLEEMEETYNLPKRFVNKIKMNKKKKNIKKFKEKFA